ncbi:MAG: hypothetical protein PHV28_01375 [Kiritimatiellae bacterium]|nr:hypothetical protein [Kiritimatiellia bacterium]
MVDTYYAGGAKTVNPENPKKAGLGRLLVPGVDGGAQKKYGVTVFRSGRENRSDVYGTGSSFSIWR